MLKKIKTIHMVGIGGSGMSGIAEVLLNLGYKVTGSDLKHSDVTNRLEELGAEIYYGHKSENVGKVDVVVISSAVSESNPEVLKAHKNAIPVIPRAEMLAELARMKYTITIAGTHGKTTTTSMVALVLQVGGLDPTVIIGGRLKNFSSGAKLGKGDFMVAEADESDGSFLKLSPTIAVVTNIDDDHLDHYGKMEVLNQAFVDHVNKVPFYGCSILCGDDSGVQSILGKIQRQYYTYGLDSKTNITARNIVRTDSGYKFNIVYNNKNIGQIKLNVSGRHDIQNALAAVCCGIELDIPFEKIKNALEEFSGVSRRLEFKGETKGIIFLDDYGHHPTEIISTLKAVREKYPERKSIVIFQPHRFTRTKILHKKFGPAFKDADMVKLMEIYPAGEKSISGISSKLILKEILKYNKNASIFNPAKELEKFAMDLKPNTVVLTLGAGDVWKLDEKIIEYL